ncbi:hypothetical protein K474DRAFT_1711364 [Panus rudis PR-1116 ss-1]|nr:hypothetical protein K474DRAFT_1711364 [Panus rudis PR-1116 ss-1]
MSEVGSIAEFYGGALSIICLSFVLYGITVVQGLTYARNSGTDPLFLKCLVAATFFLETVHACICILLIYEMTIEGFENPAHLQKIYKPCAVNMLLENVIVLIVQGFYIRRVWLSINGGDIASALLDFVIAFAMIYYLRRQTTGLNTHTNNIINWILAYTVNTGAVTSSAAIAVIISYAAMSQSLFFGGLLMMNSRLYANALLGSLNARAMLQARIVASGTINPEVAQLEVEDC